jgi:hypothetical protein
MANDRKNRPATLDHLRSQKKPMERSVPIVLVDEPGEAFQAAEAALQAAQRDYDTWLADARELQIQALRTMSDSAKSEFLVELPDPNGAEERRAPLSAAKEAVETAKQALDDATVWVRFRAIGREAYERLLDEHPPTPEEVAEADSKGEAPPAYNVETFAPALISASAIDPPMPPEFVTEIWNEWGSADLTEMFTAALIVNTFRRRHLGNG